MNPLEKAQGTLITNEGDLNVLKAIEFGKPPKNCAPTPALFHRWLSLWGSKDSSETQYWQSGSFVCLSLIGQLNAKQENKALSVEVLCQQRSRTLPLKVLCLPHLYCTGHTSWANRLASRSTFHQPTSRSVKLPQQAVRVNRTIWHDIMQAHHLK